MSPQPTPFAAAKAIAQGLRAHCLEVGPGSAGATWQVDRGTAADWRDSVDPLLPTAYALIATMLQQKGAGGSSSLFAELDRQVNGVGEGTAEDVDADSMRALAELGALVHEDAKALQGDQRISLDEAKRLLPLYEQMASLSRRIANGLRDKIRRGTP